MSMRSKATRLAALAGATALLGGLALAAAGSGVRAQTASPTPAPAAASPAPAAATPSGPTPASNVGGPSAVPSARFFGSVSVSGVAGSAPTTVTASIGGTACGFGNISSGTYTLDIQAISGCTTPGASVSFAVGSNPANETGTLPAIPGTAVRLNLTAASATPTPPPPPPPAPPTPARTASAAPPPPPPPPPASATPARTATTAPRPSATSAQGAVAQKPAAPAGAPAAAPAAAPARVTLPSTGTGGLAGQNQGGATAFALLSILLGAVLLSATGLVAYRRSR